MDQIEDHISKVNKIVREKQNLTDAFRGKILAAAILVEEWMSTVIVSHFSTKHKNPKRFIAEKSKTHYVLIQSGKWTFDEKSEILRRIILTEEYLEKKDRSLLITDIQRIAKHRNQMAHWRLDEYSPYSNEFDGKTLQFSTLNLVNNELVPDIRTDTIKSINIEIAHSLKTVESLRELDKIVWERKEN